MDSKSNEEFNDAGNNLLYFGNLYKMKFEKFKRVIKDTIVDKDSLYDSLSKDIYHQGIMLVKQFRQINLSYIVFIISLILSILAFTLSFLLHIHSN